MQAGHSSYRVPVAGDALRTEARKLGQLLVKQSTNQYRKPAQNLYDWLIRPIQHRIDDPATTALVVVPGGILRTIPFAALFDRESRRFLIEQVPIARSPPWGARASARNTPSS